MMDMRLAVAFLAFVPAFAAGNSSSVDLLAFAPADAQVLAGANVTSVKGSMIGQFVLSKVNPSDTQFQEFMSKTGINPLTDVSEVMVSASGLPGQAAHWVFAAHGTFNIASIEKDAETNGGTVSHLTGVDVLQFTSPKQACLAVFQDTFTIAAGDCDSVQAIAAGKPAAGAGAALKTAETLKAQEDAGFS